jgi:hypothetical protein
LITASARGKVLSAPIKTKLQHEDLKHADEKLSLHDIPDEVRHIVGADSKDYVDGMALCGWNGQELIH